MGNDADYDDDIDSIADPEERERARAAKAQGQKYWRAEDERYYGASAAAGRGSQGSLESGSTYPNSGAGAGGGGRWHYPANFEDSLPSDIYGGGGSGVAGDGAPGAGSRRKKSKKDKSGGSSRGKKDRWERTEDAYSGEMLDGQKPKKKKKSRKGSQRHNSSTVGGGEGGYGYDERRSSTGTSVDDENAFPEDAEGGLYGERRPTTTNTATSGAPMVGGGRVNDELEHEF